MGLICAARRSVSANSDSHGRAHTPTAAGDVRECGRQDRHSLDHLQRVPLPALLAGAVCPIAVYPNHTSGSAACQTRPTAPAPDTPIPQRERGAARAAPQEPLPQPAHSPRLPLLHCDLRRVRRYLRRVRRGPHHSGCKRTPFPAAMHGLCTAETRASARQPRTCSVSHP